MLLTKSLWSDEFVDVPRNFESLITFVKKSKATALGKII
jgi:hypothetical protein